MLTPRPFLIALQFLTILPIRFKTPPATDHVSSSLLHYPPVGLLIGVLLAITAWIISDITSFIAAALLLTVWVAVTGALHLDGLADSADAWIGGLGDRDKTLAIMKDPYCGPMAAVTLVLVLLIKFVTLEQLITADNWQALIIAPLMGRTALVLLFLTTPYVRPGGLGDVFSNYRGNRRGVAVVTLVAMSVLLLTGITGFYMLIAATLVFVLLRIALLRRLGGTTGDTAGAVVEFIETITLVAFAIA